MLERKLTMAANKPVFLSINDNCRSMIAFAERDGIVRARLHHMFLDAPKAVQSALVRYVAQGDREASGVVGSFIEKNSHRIRAARPFLLPITTQGAHHDVLSIFNGLNDKYFGGTVDSLITWGRVGSRRSATGGRRSIKLGSYSPAERLIRVHPALDRPWVPRYFVSYIVYHEMLHHVIPAVETRGGRRTVHPPHFMERESMFHNFDRALAWERRHIHRVLRTSG